MGLGRDMTDRPTDDLRYHVHAQIMSIEAIVELLSVCTRQFSMPQGLSFVGANIVPKPHPPLFDFPGQMVLQWIVEWLEEQ